MRVWARPASASCGGHLPRRRKWSSCRWPPERRAAAAGVDRRARLTCKRVSRETDPGGWVTGWRMREKEHAAARRPWKPLSEPVRADFSAPTGVRPPDSGAGVGRPACLCVVLRSSVVDGVQAHPKPGQIRGHPPPSPRTDPVAVCRSGWDEESGTRLHNVNGSGRGASPSSRSSPAFWLGHPYSLRSPCRSLETPERRRAGAAGAGAGDLRRAGLRGTEAGLGEGQSASALTVAEFAATPWAGTRRTGAGP